MPPGPRVWGADGRKGGGWVVAELTAEIDVRWHDQTRVRWHDQTRVRWHDQTHVRWHDAADAHALLRLVGDDVLAVDVPIGLPEHGLRPADEQARSALAGGRTSSVFAAPVRGVLAYGTYAAARPAHPSLSAQTFGLVPRIRDVDQALRAIGPAVHDHVVEAHPEVSLRRLTGVVLPGKKTAAGALWRLSALRAALGEIPSDVPTTAGLDDALDALACAWTARRFLLGEAEILGGEADPTGAPMRIVV